MLITEQSLFRLNRHDFGPYMVKVTLNGVQELYFGEFFDSVIVVANLVPGDYTDIIIRNAKGCLSDTITGPIMIEEHDCNLLDEGKARIFLYPNPTVNTVNIDYTPGLNDNVVTFEVVDMTGIVVTTLKRDVSKQVQVNERINVSNVKSGMYYLRIIGSDSIEYVPIEIVK